MKKNQIILIIIGVLILIGLTSSFSYQLGQKSITVKSEIITNPLESKVVQNWSATAVGEVTEISGRSLTLSKEGDTLTILIREDVPIYRLLPLKEEIRGAPQLVEKEEVEFSQIKVGDQVEIPCKLKADGSLESETLIIFSTI